jgi:hypothetical protein
MMMKTAETQNGSHERAGNRPLRTTRLTVEGQIHRNSSTTSVAAFTDRTRSQHEDTEAVRREHAKLQQAIFMRRPRSNGDSAPRVNWFGASLRSPAKSFRYAICPEIFSKR